MAKFFKIPFAATGDILAVPDATQPDGSVSYSQGFGPDYQRKTDGTDPLAKTVPRNSTNALFNDLTGAVGEIQLNGVPAWQLVGAPYPINAIVRHNNKNWISQVANNSATPVEGASWSEQPVNSYTKAQIDTKLATKANTATTIAGYGITDAYTKTQVDSALSGKANTATTLGGYGIADAYTKTESDARYLQDTNNLSDLPNKSTARTNLELGTAATATLQISQTDSVAGRALIQGAFGLGLTKPTVTDFNAATSTFFVATGSAANAPAGLDSGAVFGINLGAEVFTSTKVQLAYAPTAAKSFVRRFNSGAWGSWDSFNTSSSFSSAINLFLSSADKPSARASLDILSAALRDATASTSDATIGRIPKNGDKQVCRAWVNFDGSGATISIRDSFNVTSIIDNGTANYTVNFSQTLDSTNYAVTGAARTTSAVSTGGSLALLNGDLKTTSAVQVRTNANNATGNTAVDSTEVDVFIFAG